MCIYQPQNAGLKVAAKDEAEAAKIKLVKAAEAEGERTRIQAEAEAEATYLSGVGMARQVRFTPPFLPFF